MTLRWFGQFITSRQLFLAIKLIAFLYISNSKCTGAQLWNSQTGFKLKKNTINSFIFALFENIPFFNIYVTSFPSASSFKSGKTRKSSKTLHITTISLQSSYRLIYRVGMLSNNVIFIRNLV